MTETQVRLETLGHIAKVSLMINDVVQDLECRANGHDLSKLESPEFEIFMEYTQKLKGSTYGSDEYKGFLTEMKVALDHHYENNRHHPEHFPNGIGDMNLLDLLEMLADWKAATMRHDDGDIYKSLEYNKERFNIPEPLYKLLLNTIDDYNDKWGEHGSK